MSWEGYTQKICAKGHHNIEKQYTELHYCPDCGAVFVWENVVDQTNGCEYDSNGSHKTDCQCGFAPVKCKTQSESCTCNNCGLRHRKEKSYDIFYIPKNMGRFLVPREIISSELFSNG